MLNNATFHICPLFSQHVLGQTIHWQLPKERWPTVGTVNGRIGGTKMSSRRRKNLLRRGCDTAPFSRRRDWRCRAYELSERALSNCYAPKLLTACCVHSSVALLAGWAKRQFVTSCRARSVHLTSPPTTPRERARRNLLFRCLLLILVPPIRPFAHTRRRPNRPPFLCRGAVWKPPYSHTKPVKIPV